MTKELQQNPSLTGGVMPKDKLPGFNTPPNRELEEYKLSLNSSAAKNAQHIFLTVLSILETSPTFQRYLLNWTTDMQCLNIIFSE